MKIARILIRKYPNTSLQTFMIYLKIEWIYKCLTKFWFNIILDSNLTMEAWQSGNLNKVHLSKNYFAFLFNGQMFCEDFAKLL